jgi:hypothetical protein
MAPRKKDRYCESIHVLFKLKGDNFYIGTCGIITYPKLPSDNISLSDEVEKWLAEKTELKIR